MRTYELRVYTLRSPAALELYSGTIYPRHLKSFPLFGVEAHGFWTVQDDSSPRLFVLVSYAEGDDPRAVAHRYLQSEALADDIKGFDVQDIVNVETTVLVPSPSSPLQ
jgi:hypothetical protein